LYGDTARKIFAIRSKRDLRIDKDVSKRDSLLRVPMDNSIFYLRFQREREGGGRDQVRQIRVEASVLRRGLIQIDIIAANVTMLLLPGR